MRYAEPNVEYASFDFYSNKPLPHIHKGTEDKVARQIRGIWRSFSESAWIKGGKPYFKVSDRWAMALSKTTLAIPCEQLQLPFPAFAVRMGAVNGPFAWKCGEFCGQLGSIIVAEYASQEGRELILLLYASTINGTPINVLLGRCDLSGHATVEQAILRGWKAGRNKNCGFWAVAFDVALRVCRLIVSVALLATGNREWLTPDLLSKDADKLATATPEEIERMHDKARRRGKYGWIIGDQHLPREYRESDPSDPTGRHLKHQHLRCGHFAAVRCGVGREQIKLVWRKMTVVRPDLPVNASAVKGYKIG